MTNSVSQPRFSASILLIFIFFEAFVLNTCAATVKEDLVVLEEVSTSLDNCQHAVESLEYLLDDFVLFTTTTGDQAPNATTQVTNSNEITTLFSLTTNASESFTTSYSALTTTQEPHITPIPTTVSEVGVDTTTGIINTNEITTSSTNEYLTFSIESSISNNESLTTSQPFVSTSTLTATMYTTEIKPNASFSSPITSWSNATTVVSATSQTTKEASVLITTEFNSPTTQFAFTTSTLSPARNALEVPSEKCTFAPWWGTNVSDVLSLINSVLDNINADPLEKSNADNLNRETYKLNILVYIGTNCTELVAASDTESLSAESNDTLTNVANTKMVIDDEITIKTQKRNTNILISWLVPVLVIIVVVALLCVCFKPWNRYKKSSINSTTSAKSGHEEMGLPNRLSANLERPSQADSSISRTEMKTAYGVSPKFTAPSDC